MSDNTSDNEIWEEEYPFGVKETFEGIRTQSLSFEASLFELIDNSLGHGEADKIDIRIEWFTNNKKIKKVAVVDNGIGMSRRTLFNALKTGKSGTYNQRDTIGRFGFGLKAGGLNQCRHIEVFSKEKDSDPHQGVLDFDEFLDGKEKISPPQPKDIPDEYTDIIDDHGTVVTWDNLDIAEGPEEGEEFEEFKYIVGRTFRKFIGEEIISTDEEGKLVAIENENKRTITINGKKVIPWDPLYFTKVPGFVDDPKSTATYQGELIVPIHMAEGIDNDEREKLTKYNFDTVSQDNLFQEDENGMPGDVIKIRFAILPKDWRKKKGEGDSDFNKKRWIPHNEGISILRAGREVSRLSIHGLTGKKDTIDRWWGLEIDYPPTLDRWFKIKNVKVGLEPNKELRKMFNDLTSIKQTKARALESIQDHWTPPASTTSRNSKITCPECQTENDAGAEECSNCNKSLTKQNDHEDAEETFSDTGVGRPRIFTDMNDEEKEEYFKSMEERFDNFDAITDRERFEELAIKFLTTTTLPPNMPFIDVNPGIGTTELTYNLTHVFFRKIYEIMDTQRELSKNINEELDDDEMTDELNTSINQMRYCIDLLLGSFAGAHVSIDPTVKQEAKTTLNLLLQQWTSMLQIVTEDDRFGTRTENN